MVSTDLLEALKALKTTLSNGETPSHFLDDIPHLLEVLGETDGEIRDKLGWATLSRLFRNPAFPPESRKPLVELLTTEAFLFHDIALGETDSSVKRSFSSLCLADLIAGDREHARAFDTLFLASLSDIMRSYFSMERDRRGFEARLGWVHCLAHAADALGEMIEHPSFPNDRLADVYASIFDYIEKQGHDVFKWDEEYRLALPLAAAFRRCDADYAQRMLLERFGGSFLMESPSRQNFLNTFRAVYLELLWSGFEDRQVLEKIKDVILCRIE